MDDKKSLDKFRVLVLDKDCDMEEITKRLESLGAEVVSGEVEGFNPDELIHHNPHLVGKSFRRNGYPPIGIDVIVGDPSFSEGWWPPQPESIMYVNQFDLPCVSDYTNMLDSKEIKNNPLTGNQYTGGKQYRDETPLPRKPITNKQKNRRKNKKKQARKSKRR